MKRLKSIYFLTIIAMVFYSSLPVLYAQEAEELKREIMDGVNEVSAVNETLKKTGKVEERCPGCAEAAPKETLLLDKEELSLVHPPYYLKSGDPYVIFLKRTASSPASVDIKFRNGHRYCGKSYVGPNPWMPSGPLIIDCLIYLTRYEDQEISLNMKKLRKLEEGEEEIIEVRLAKKDPNASGYSMNVKNLSDVNAKEEVDKKFFGSGYNVSFK